MNRTDKRGKWPKEVIFRRYRRDPSGKILDAHDYGLKAWPIRISQ